MFVSEQYTFCFTVTQYECALCEYVRSVSVSAKTYFNTNCPLYSDMFFMNFGNVKITVSHSEDLHLLLFLSGDRHCHLFFHHTPQLVSGSFTFIHFTHSYWIPLLVLPHICSSLILLRTFALFYVFSMHCSHTAYMQGLH